MNLGYDHPAIGPFTPHLPQNWSLSRSPLGAHFHTDTGVLTFAVHSGVAERVLLEIYEHPFDERPMHDYWLARGDDGTWRAEVSMEAGRVAEGIYYAFRCWGPNWPFDPEWRRGGSGAGFQADVDDAGNRFNPNKALIDPYAREHSHEREAPALRGAGLSGEIYGTGAKPFHQAPRRDFDTGPWVPKGIVVSDQTGYGVKPGLRQKDAIIYEAHLQGLTCHASVLSLPELMASHTDQASLAWNNGWITREECGTYRAAGKLAPYFKAIGINVVELLPCHQINDEVKEFDPPRRVNFWGYNTDGFFAPNRRYAFDQTPGGPTREFKEMMAAFHAHGIEVYLDVVYNHTGEGGLWEDDPDTTGIVSFRGFDNAGYYMLSGPRHFWVSSGVGNNFNVTNAAAAQLILDSIDYWTHEMGVDGFRFDLAAILGRDGADRAFDRDADLLRRLADFSYQQNTEIIAEAWDTNTYQVGNFPLDWAEWNGQFRDVVRDFIRGKGDVNAFIRMLNGDYQSFADQGGPQKSVNFLTAHDGFTLMDLVSYNQKINHNPYPFGPSDGGENHNRSYDWAQNKALRRQVMRTLRVCQIFARGVPMFVWGEEFGRTQNGNNNSYNVNGLANFNHYGMIATSSPHLLSTETDAPYHDNYGTDANGAENAFFIFNRRLNQFRMQHGALRQNRFADFTPDEGRDVSYLFTSTNGDRQIAGYERALRLFIDGSQVDRTSGLPYPLHERDCDFLVLINFYWEKLPFLISAPNHHGNWKRILDTAAWAEPDGNFWESDETQIRFANGSTYDVAARSAVVLCPED